MQNILTRSEILSYHQKGISVIQVEEMPLLTDLAKEELNRLGMTIAVGSAASTGQGTAPAAPAGRPASGGGGYGSGARYPAGRLPFPGYLYDRFFLERRADL